MTITRHCVRSALLAAALAALSACGEVGMMSVDSGLGSDSAPSGDVPVMPGADSGSVADVPVMPGSDVVSPPIDAPTARDVPVVPMDVPVPRDVPAPPPDAGPLSAMWTEMLNAINAARATPRSCGAMAFRAAPPLTWNDQLATAAQGHSQVMAMTSCFSHDMTGSTPCRDGDPCRRIVAAGYRFSTWGENIAGGQPTVAAVMAGWLASPGHCANIMNQAFRQVGAGMARGGRFGIYWTQKFGTPGGSSTCR